MSRKRIEMIFWVTTGKDKFDTCTDICNLLDKTVLATPEFDLAIEEIKVIDERSEYPDSNSKPSGTS